MLHRIVVTAALLFGLSVPAYADILAAGPIYGGTTQFLAACYLFNAGSGPVNIITNQIVQQNGANVALIADDCSILQAGRACVISAKIVNSQTHSCRMVITPSANDVRGALEIRSGTGGILNSLELR